ncbi:MAG: formate dehydrogenase accessory sulfurtransferase FdhD [Candidatus Lokiarchaeota archaeon]|nr:formate dehydrogenase accessory sulfurtransferase FdhD [Candidatus Lokiarchaeota archaeon]
MYKRLVKITKIKKDQASEEQDIVLVESPMDIIVNSKPLANIICLPNDLKDLAIGFLYSIGLIQKKEDLKTITIEELENKIMVELDDKLELNPKALEINPVSRVIDTTCGISSPWRNLIKEVLDKRDAHFSTGNEIKIKPDFIYTIIKKMQQNTVIFRETGGCHGAAVFDLKGNMLACKEDIGRHNAIDKVIGEMLIKEDNFTKFVLTSTGRLTGDSVLKAVRAGFPILASVSTAIESGIRLAFSHGITLIGFVRGARMNIYAHPNRILL